MVAIYRGQRGLVQGQQIAAPPSSRHLYDYPLWAAARSVLLPIGSFHFLTADYRLRVVIDLEACLKLRPN
jgi:hypothetical protein